jgi:hypothetical protein
MVDADFHVAKEENRVIIESRRHRLAIAASACAWAGEPAGVFAQATARTDAASTMHIAPAPRATDILNTLWRS